MNVALRQTMTLEQFLAWEDRQELRYEFDGFQPVAMVGGTVAHAAIQRNIIVALMGRLHGNSCQPYGSDLKIEVCGRIRYPDALIICTPVSPNATVISDPVVVFEVLSKSTANTDVFVKSAEYRATPSIQRYVILQQTHAGALVFSRKGEDWVAETLSGDDAVLRMPEAGIEVPMSEFYIGIDLSVERDEASAEN